jgi:hypothetical protein
MTDFNIDKIFIEECEPAIFFISGFTMNRLPKNIVHSFYNCFVEMKPEPKFVLYNKNKFQEFDLVSLPYYISDKQYNNKLLDFKTFYINNKNVIDCYKKIFFFFDIDEKYKSFLEKTGFHLCDLTDEKFYERLIEYARN